MRELTFNETNQINGALSGCETIGAEDAIMGGAAIGTALAGIGGGILGSALGASFVFGWNSGVYINELIGQCEAN